MWHTHDLTFVCCCWFNLLSHCVPSVIIKVLNSVKNLLGYRRYQENDLSEFTQGWPISAITSRQWLLQRADSSYHSKKAAVIAERGNQREEVAIAWRQLGWWGSGCKVEHPTITVDAEKYYCMKMTAKCLLWFIFTIHFTPGNDSLMGYVTVQCLNTILIYIKYNIELYLYVNWIFYFLV